MRIELMPLLAAMKEMHHEITALKKLVGELKDEISSPLRSIVHFDLGEDSGEESGEDEESESGSVQSAPATVSYDFNE